MLSQKVFSVCCRKPTGCPGSPPDLPHPCHCLLWQDACIRPCTNRRPTASRCTRRRETLRRRAQSLCLRQMLHFISQVARPTAVRVQPPFRWTISRSLPVATTVDSSAPTTMCHCQATQAQEPIKDLARDPFQAIWTRPGERWCCDAGHSQNRDRHPSPTDFNLFCTLSREPVLGCVRRSDSLHWFTLCAFLNRKNAIADGDEQGVVSNDRSRDHG